MSLSPETEEVLRRARLSTAMSPNQRRHLKSRIVARIAATGALLVASDAAARGGVALWSSTLGGAAKGVAALAVVASLGAGGYMATRAMRGHAPVAPSAHHEPEPTRHVEPAVQSPAPQQVEAPVVAPKLEPTSKAHATHRAPAAVETPNTLLEEGKLLQEADRALRAGNTDRAMALLDQHAGQFPKSQLAPERAAERMVGLCQSGKADAAAGERFLATHPSSPLGARIKQACHVGGQ